MSRHLYENSINCLARHDKSLQIAMTAVKMAPRLVFSPLEDEILLQEVQDNSVMYNFPTLIIEILLWRIVSGKKYTLRLENLVSNNKRKYTV